MSDKYNRQVRKGVNNLYREAYSQVLNSMKAKVYSASFLQRVKMGLRYIFKKDYMQFF